MYNVFIEFSTVSLTQFYHNTSKNPKYQLAFKLLNGELVRKTTVVDIEWNVSRWGKLIPVAILSPIHLPDVTISRVTLNNASHMMSRHIGIGSIVEVVRSNEVIPYILNVCKPSDNYNLPVFDYKWDDNKTHIQVTTNIPEIQIKSMVNLEKP